MKLIHKYNMNGYNIVVDVNGGAVHVVDDVTYRVLDYYEDKKVEDIVGLLAGEFSEDKVMKKLRDLLKRGYCTQKMSMSSILVL